jgi:UDP-3-O-[3-hydroxymyristoyl] glucosamine N-acyltransferase
VKLSEIAEKLEARLEGQDCEINGIAGIEEALPGQITFVANEKYAPAAKSTKASAVIVDEKFPAITAATLRTKNPYLAFSRAIRLFYNPPRYRPGVHSTAVVSESAKIGKHAHIGAYVVIDEDVEIGDNSVLLPHVVIYRGAKIGNNFFAHAHSVVREFCRLGNDVVLQNGVIIGADGFGFAKDNEGRWEKIVQSGPTILEDDVEVQANSCVDRASVGETRIGRNTKIDNLAQIGHGSTIGERTMVCAQVGLAGSTEIGNNVILAGQVGVAGHCTVGDNVIITAQSGTHGDIEPGRMISGSPGFDHRQWMRAVAAFAKLPELARKIRDLEGKVEAALASKQK